MDLRRVEVHQRVDVPSEQDHNDLHHLVNRACFALDRAIDLGQKLPLNKLWREVLRHLLYRREEQLQPLSVLVVL